MSVRRLHPDQPKHFAFTKENIEFARAQIAKYPPGRQASAIIPLLWQAQKQSGGWLPEPAIRHVADMLAMPYMRALEVATFYTMFNLQPVGEHFIQLCGTTPCMLRGAEDLRALCREHIGEAGEVSADGKLSWAEVECLGACVNAPVAQINDDFYEDLTPQNFTEILHALAKNEPVQSGTQIARQTSAPEGGQTTLKDGSPE